MGNEHNDYGNGFYYCTSPVFLQNLPCFRMRYRRYTLKSHEIKSVKSGIVLLCNFNEILKKHQLFENWCFFLLKNYCKIPKNSI